MTNSFSLPYSYPAIHWLQKLRRLPYPILLDSRDDNDHRFDYVSALPESVWRHQRGTGEIAHHQAGSFKYGNFSGLSEFSPFEQLRNHLNPIGRMPLDGLPDSAFQGGLLGYFGYDLARSLESLPMLLKDDSGVPDACVGMYRWALVIDHLHKQTTVSFADDMPQADISLITRALEADSVDTDVFTVTSELVSNFTHEQYLAAFNKLKQYIQEGDCYQANLAQRFSAHYTGDPFQAFRIARQSYGSAFSAFFDTGKGALLSFSPERFMSLADGTVITEPIKGTRPRSADPTTDTQLAEQLQNSTKDQAENLMIVDLLRNDLGRCCTAGSIKVEKLFQLKSFTNVHHLVSRITGKLAEQRDVFDLLAASFPGGSITGAPKIRAMEIIEELEPNRRGPYCGSLGFIDSRGHMETNILIRTMVCSDEKLYFWGGGGIVADSEGESEFQETLHKVAGLHQVLISLTRSSSLTS